MNTPITFLLIFFISILVSSSHSSPSYDDVTELVVASLKQTISKVNVSSSNFSDLRNHLGSNISHGYRCAFEDCLELLDDTVFDLTTATSLLHSHSPQLHSVKMFLSAAMTNTRTCLDGLDGNENSNDNKAYRVAESLKESLLSMESLLSIYSHISNSLAMLEDIPINIEDDTRFPKWVSGSDRDLVEAPVDETKVNLVVAQNGSGNYTAIGEAVAAAPNGSQTRFVIYIKSGVYFENIEIRSKKTMIMFIGDGIGRTVIKANRSKHDGWKTFGSATVGVGGSGFIAKDISFVNYAGPDKEQAVAFRSDSDHSAFYRCSFEGYQDTLYVHSHTQFYRECHIYGTVDFIFGDASVVFQNCSLYARRPNPKQTITYTAQSRDNPNQPTGISIINCKILAAPDLIPVQANFKAYLGRPWGAYSRTVIMKSFIDGLVDPTGWLKWDNNASTLGTLYYGEYMNEGPGSNMKNRIQWPGFKRIETQADAIQFSVGPFIQGDKWLSSTGIPFTLDL